MPVYTYQCTTCSQTFDIQARMQDPAPTKGPSCEQSSCQLLKRPGRVFGHVAGQSQPPPVTKQPEVKPTSPAHICSKYCDLHK